MKISPLKAICFGALLGLGCVMLIGAGLTKFVGQFYGNGAGLTNVPASSTVSGVVITNGVFQWQLDATFEDAMYKFNAHGIELDYRRIDLGAATALFRTVDNVLHFPNGFMLDTFSDASLGVDASGNLIAVSPSTPINNFYVTNVVIYDSLTIQTNLIVNQNITVKGQATLNTIIITNTALFSTNAFPLAPGTVWNLSRYFQFIDTNADFVISALAGLSNSLLNMAELQISNSAAGNITISLNFAGNKIGPNTTNSIVLPSHKQAYVAVQARGVGTVTNYVTQVEQ